MSDQRFDYIIIGAGSAGAVLASRLTEDPDCRVLLLEAGPMDYSLWIHMPSAFDKPMGSRRYNWGYATEPEPFMDNRRMDCPRGHVLGGSSSINGMAYVRGNALDYEGWAEDFGLESWRYAGVLPYFRRAEDFDQGANDYHGAGGPLHVTTGAMRNPLYGAFVAAGTAAGYPATDDMNGHQQEGFGPMFMTTRDGVRCSTANAYLRPVLKRPNLVLKTRALTETIRFDSEAATGVRYRHRGQTLTARADGEVLLCAGAINSPQILKRSGVGPGDELQQHGIDVIRELPGVGENLQDHLEVYVQYACREPITLFSALKPWNQARIGLQWLTTRRGLGASNHFESGGFIRTEAGVPYPDVQYHFMPIAVTYDGSVSADCHGFQAHVGPMRPESRGHVRLRSAEPEAPPSIVFNYMGTERDRWEMRQAVRLTREILEQSPMDRFRGDPLSPGPDITSNEAIDAWVRVHGESAYHPAGTCRMGTADDPAAVVDGDGRVHGLQALRVVDASIMPRITTGNLNAPTIMMAEKLADAIRGRDTEWDPKPWYQAPDWQHRQR